jgi:uncharacterized protein
VSGTDGPTQFVGERGCVAVVKTFNFWLVGPPLSSATVIWRGVLDDASFEQCRFSRSRDAIHLSGTILAGHENRPLKVSYQILCDLAWRTREVAIQQDEGFERSDLKLSVAAESWSEAERGSLSEITDCIDVDIELTPATNALPINRLNLAIGDSGEIQAAWIRLPSLTIVRAHQRYERLSEKVYRYTGIASGFQAEIEVDQFGLPIRYGNIWERIAAV